MNRWMPTVPPRHFSEWIYQDESSGVVPPAHKQVADGVTNCKREEPPVFLAAGSPRNCAIRWRYWALLGQGSSGELAATAKL